MEEKYICPTCGAEMIATYVKPALNLSCPKCGCKIATSKWDDIDLDATEYEIVLKSTDNPDMDKIKLISKMTGLNFIQTKALLCNGGSLLKGKAVDIKATKEILEKNDIEFEIKPTFPY